MSDSIILACPTLKKELQQALVEHQCSVPVFYLPQELHNSPPRLKEYVQSFIDNIDNVELAMNQQPVALEQYATGKQASFALNP